MIHHKLERLKDLLIVSCQALEYEPLHGSEIIAKMALAAQYGGAGGIRANGIEDIAAIKRTVNLPIIGIIKAEYDDSSVYITPTMREVDELLEIGVDIIACDATQRVRPEGKSLEEYVVQVKKAIKTEVLMGDIATVEDAQRAEELGFDCVATTLYGYTAETKGREASFKDFEFLRSIVKAVKIPVIAEGMIDSPEKAKRVKELGAYAVVVGTAITRPQVITKKFVDALQF